MALHHRSAAYRTFLGRCHGGGSPLDVLDGHLGFESGLGEFGRASFGLCLIGRLWAEALAELLFGLGKREVCARFVGEVPFAFYGRVLEGVYPAEELTRNALAEACDVFDSAAFRFHSR